MKPPISTPGDAPEVTAAIQHENATGVAADPSSLPSDQPGSGVRAVLSAMLSTVVTILCVAVVAVAVGSLSGAYRLDTVLSGSMLPAYSPGDLVYATAVPANQIRVGDVVMFTSPEEYGSDPVTHRVVSAEVSESGVVMISTKGDNNDAADPWQAQVTTPEVWVVHKSVPKLGYVSVWAKDWWPLLLGLALAIPMLRTGWRRSAGTSTDRAATSAPPTARRRTLGATLLWLTPGMVTVAAVIWASLSLGSFTGNIEQTARSWQGDRAPQIQLVDRFSLRLQAVGEYRVRTLLDSPESRDVTAGVQQLATISTENLSPEKGLALTAASPSTDVLTQLLHLHVRECDTPWNRIADPGDLKPGQPVGDEGFTCPGQERVLVGNAPLEDTTIRVLNAAEVTRDRDVYLLLELRTDPDAGPRPAVGDQARFDVRIDAA